jgi:hypothetical protein
MHMIQIGDTLPEGKLSAFVEVEGNGCSIGPNDFDIRKETADGAPELAEHDRFAALEKELEEAKSKALYAAAEAQNVRRRLEAEKQQAASYASAGFARDMLAVRDHLDRAELLTLPASTSTALPTAPSRRRAQISPVPALMKTTRRDSGVLVMNRNSGAALASLCLVLSACGGGGGGSSTPPPSSTTPPPAPAPKSGE